MEQYNIKLYQLKKCLVLRNGMVGGKKWNLAHACNVLKGMTGLVRFATFCDTYDDEVKSG